MTTLDYGRRVMRVGPGMLVDARSLVLCTILWSIIAVLAIFAVTTGSASISLGEVVDVIRGRGDDYTSMVVGEWRAPRVVLAIILGVCLALSGAIFQNLTRNPLGSPDVIGFQTGAFTGALVVMLVLRGGAAATMMGALAGGIATALVVFFLSSSQGAVKAVRLIIVGIGVGAMLSSFNVWLMLTATVEDATMAGLWGAGNLSGASWQTVVVVGVGSGAFVLGAAVLGRPLRLQQIGVPFATALGQNVRLVQVAALLVGIGLTAVATASVGPISFIALASPQIARRLARTDGLALGPSAAVGALLLLLADVTAQRIYPVSPLPVGIVTVSIGGLYFLWLLLREGKNR
ncbi:iron complex transport system permease protein [Corynebacterium timonense]|uniref:Iron complex transport system permease protein n=2 Tax=Corynebacterium timonense TaxID=441500 RepID=A0A1H1PM42_9CORY|nr:iron complex transport system permease protein [Corynebacterium timonense]